MKKIALAILNAFLAVYWFVESILVAIGIDGLPTSAQVCACLITGLLFLKLAIRYSTDV